MSVSHASSVSASAIRTAIECNALCSYSICIHTVYRLLPTHNPVPLSPIHPPRQVFFDTFLLYDMTQASPAALRGIGVLTDLCDGAAAGKPAPLPPRAPEEGVDPEETRKNPVEKSGLDRTTPTPPKGESPPSGTGRD